MIRAAISQIGEGGTEDGASGLKEKRKVTEKIYVVKEDMECERRGCWH